MPGAKVTRYVGYFVDVGSSVQFKDLAREFLGY